MKARDPGRRKTPGKVLKERRSPRRRGRMGTSVQNEPAGPRPAPLPPPPPPPPPSRVVARRSRSSSRLPSPPPSSFADATPSWAPPRRAYARSVIPASARVGGGDASLADRSRAAIAAVALDAPSHARRSRSSSLARFRVSNSSRAFSSSSARSSSNWRACSASLRRKVFAERAYLRVVPYKATSGRSSKASVGVEGVEDGD